MKLSAFFDHNIARGSGGGVGGGGRRDEPKAAQKIVLRSRVLRNYCLEGLFHTVPSSFVLHCSFLIDLFTDTAAILNLLDLRSIMGCPGGTRSVFTRAFRVKRELQCIFLGKKAIIIISKLGKSIFSHCNLFLGKFKEKLVRKARVNTDASKLDRPHGPWASHNTP